MLTLTFIAQAWEGLLTPNLRRGQAQAARWCGLWEGAAGKRLKGAEKAEKGCKGLTFTAQLTNHHLKLQLSNVLTLPGIPLFGNV